MVESEEKENPIMRADEARKLLKIGRNTLYEWCRQGIIPHRRIGHLLFFSRKEIINFMENNMEGMSKFYQMISRWNFLTKDVFTFIQELYK